MTRISVIVPAFNAAATLAETLASIAAQTRRADEVIVIDDGSTDATTDIARMAPGVTLLQQANGGVATALNTGLAAATGALVGFLDADDVWTSDCLAVHERHLAQKPELDGSVAWVEEFVCPSLDAAAAARFRPRAAQPGWLGGATMLRRAAVGRTGAFDPALRLGAWIDWVDRARRAGALFGVIDTVVLRRRLRPGTLSTGSGTQARDTAFLEVARRALARRRGGAS